MNKTAINFSEVQKKMEMEGLPKVAIQTFAHYYNLLVTGETGMISEQSIKPVVELPDADALADKYEDVGLKHLNQAVVIKLNGGLGTSMGLSKAKSLLQVKNGLSFLDIIGMQAQAQKMPVVLMNSFSTQTDSLEAMRNYPGLNGDLDSDFLQHKVPKIRLSDMAPVEYKDNPELEWCPPGHGDIYTALITSGMLNQLLDGGFKYAFVSNSDNLGAVVDHRILGYFVHQKLPFMMEVADRTAADRKGGHLAVRAEDGQLILRESAQCAEEDVDAFQDINVHKYFNTNNLWVNLVALKKAMEARNYVLGLPMIRNSKTVNPRDKNSEKVYQLETAMGSAIAVFGGAGAIRVPRTRFAPVKTTGDLLAVRSDCYVLTDDHRIVPNPARELDQIVVKLDPDQYKLIDQMEAAFPQGAPSLIKANTFTVNGKFVFGRNVKIEGYVSLENSGSVPKMVEDDTVLV
ncbi:MAG: UTP--glucose-1-phosphate uridylyltransferase [Candidatus Promineifilaceae bacterium]|jgi:UTP--glucose-1-phosphate uridylyltransferase